MALRLLICAVFAAVIGMSALRVVNTLHRPGDVPEFRQGLTDFHHIFVFPATAAREGVNPYHAEFMQRFPVNRQYPLYSPAMFWLAYPLAFIPLVVADVAYFSATVLLVVALAASALYVCCVPRTLLNVIGLSTLILMSRPGHVNLLTGQPTLLIVLGAVWALELARRRPNWAGIALAATTLKPTFGVPLIWFMFCRRDFRAVAVGGAICVATVVIGLAPFVARQGLHPVLTSLSESQSQHEADPTVAAETTWTRLDAHSLLGKLLQGEAGHEINLGLTAAILLIAGWIVWRTETGPLTDGADNLSGLVICTATLACIYHATYDALLLIVPWVGVALGRLRTQLSPKLQMIVFALLTIPAVNYASARAVLSRLPIEGPTWTAITAINSIAIVAVFVLACGCLEAFGVHRSPIQAPSSGRKPIV
jgi:hypothetical protein